MPVLRTARADPAGRAHRRRLVGRLRDDAGPQRADWRGAAGATPGRFLYATGFSGHGFQQAPAVGEIVRDLYLGREPFVDVSPLAAGQAERRERNVI